MKRALLIAIPVGLLAAGAAVFWCSQDGIEPEATKADVGVVALAGTDSGARRDARAPERAPVAVPDVGAAADSGIRSADVGVAPARRARRYTVDTFTGEGITPGATVSRVTRGFEGQSRAFRACFDGHIDTLASQSGRVTMQMRRGGDGRIGVVSQPSPWPKAPAVRQCLAEVARDVSVAPPADRRAVFLRIRFHARAAFAAEE